MRDIKFKAWIKFLQELQVVQQLNRDGSVVVDDYDYCMVADAVELMQYTGLKDKNGVDIYEGDIVRVVADGEFSHIHHVEFKEGCFPVDVTGGEYDVTTMWWATDEHHYEYEIIGNVYENPDLLENAK